MNAENPIESVEVVDDEQPVLETLLLEPEQPGEAPTVVELRTQQILRPTRPRKIALNDPEALARLAAVKESTASILATLDACVWDLGAILGPVRDEKLYFALGYKNFDHYCPSELALSSRDARLYIDFSRYFTRNEFLELRFSRARVIIKYLRATPEDDTFHDLANHQLRHGQAAGKLVEIATIAEIEEAARGEAGKLQAPVIPEGLTTILDNLQQALGEASRVGLSKAPKKGDLPAEIAIDLKQVRVTELRSVAQKLLAFAEQLEQA